MQLPRYILLSCFAALASAQFQFFEQMFNQGGQQQQQHQHQQQRQQNNVPSDSDWYQKNHEAGPSTSPPPSLSLRCILPKPPPPPVADDDACCVCVAHCTNYLCPGTLACVHFPHHCPCPFPAGEDKVELAEGSAICVSKGGFQRGEAARKIELARKGVL